MVYCRLLASLSSSSPPPLPLCTCKHTHAAHHCILGVWYGGLVHVGFVGGRLFSNFFIFFSRSELGDNKIKCDPVATRV